MDAVVKLEMETRFNREIDLIRAELRDRTNDKASNKDVELLAKAFSDSRLDQSERNRAIKASVDDVEKAVKALAHIVSADSDGTPIPSRWSLSRFDPKLLLTVGIAGGAAAGKTLEYLIGLSQ